MSDTPGNAEINFKRDFEKDVTLDNFEEKWLANMEMALTEEDPFPEYAEHLTGNPVTVGPRLPDAGQWTEDMIAGAANNSGKWKRNVLAPKKNAKQQAIASNTKWKNQMQAAIAANSYEAGVRGYDEDAMMDTINQIGEQAYTSGIEARRSKIQRKVGLLHTALLGHVRTMDSMPTDTDQQREAKMVANLRGMRGLKQILRGQTGGR